MQNMYKTGVLKRVKILCGLFIALVIIGITSASAFALVNATITATPVITEKGKTVIVEVAVYPTGAQEHVTGFDLYLSYDPNVFGVPTVTDYNQGAWDFSQIDKNYDSNGVGLDSVKYTKAAIDPAKGIDLAGSVKMYKLEFPVKAGALLGNTSLVMTDNFFNVLDQNFNPITGTFTSAVVGIVNPIVLLTPNSANRGATNLVITIDGQNTNFSNTSTVQFTDGTGITVANVQYLSATEIKATVNVAADATLGSGWDVLVRENGTVIAKGTDIFTVNDATPATPTGLTVNGIMQKQATPSWNSVAGVTEYDISYGTDPAATNLGTKVTTETWATIAGLNVETIYYVKVKSKNQYGESAYTNAAQFTTLAVATPTNLTVNGIDQNNATPSWYSSDGATGYTISYGTDPSATNLGTKESTDPWKTLNGLTADTNYYVKVRADNSGKTSSVYTTPVSFKTNALNALGKPTVTIDNISQTQARASWTKVEYADSYLLSVGINPQADSLGTIEVAGLLTDITGLNPGTTYYVKVRAQNASQSGDWSNTVSFTTPSIGTPVITSISPNRGPVNTQITISGSGFGGPADGRCLIFNNVEQRNIPPSSSNIVSWTDTAIVVKIPEWVKGVYKVSVSEKSNYSVSASNDDKTFTIMAVSTLAKTYPNPFNPLKELEKIEFVMTAGANVQVYLYDMTGQPIWKSGTQYFAAGTQTIIWDGITFFSNFAGDGIVMVRVINEDEKTLIAKGKILVIKR